MFCVKKITFLRCASPLYTKSVEHFYQRSCDSVLEYSRLCEVIVLTPIDRCFVYKCHTRKTLIDKSWWLCAQSQHRNYFHFHTLFAYQLMPLRNSYIPTPSLYTHNIYWFWFIITPQPIVCLCALRAYTRFHVCKRHRCSSQHICVFMCHRMR